MDEAGFRRIVDYRGLSAPCTLGTSRPAHRHPPRLDRAPCRGAPRPGKQPAATKPQAIPVAGQHHVGIAAHVGNNPLAIGVHAEDGGYRLARRELQPGLPAIVEHLHRRDRGIAGQLPIESEPRRGDAGCPPTGPCHRRRAGRPCATGQARQRAGEKEDSYHVPHHPRNGDPGTDRTTPGMVNPCGPERQTGMYAWIESPSPTRQKRGQGRGQEKSPVRKPGLRALPDGARAPGRLARPQRCVAMLRAWLAALFRAATGGVLPSSASLSCWLNTGSMRS